MSQIFGQQFSQSSEPPPKDVVFIHGMFMTPKCWEKWAERFAKAGYRAHAPAWPLHESPIEQQRQKENFPMLGQIKLADVVQTFRRHVRDLGAKPLLIGHSMGGLVAQLLLTEGLAAAAAAIDSAAPKGVFVPSFSFLKANWGVINPWASADRPIEMTPAEFSYAFTNAQSAAERERIYQEYYVPESRRVGKGTLSDVAAVDARRQRGPLLLVAGERDHIIPASLNKANLQKYSKTPAYSELRVFKNRDHSLLVSEGWEEIADSVLEWVKDRFAVAAV